MEKINILFVQNTMGIGGSERAMADLIRGLDRDRFRPVLCCLYGLGPFGEELQAEGYEVYYDLVSAKYDARSILKVAAIMRQEKTCILYVPNALLNVFVGRLAAVLARVPRCVLIFQSYDTLKVQFMSCTTQAKLWLTETLTLRHFDRYVAVAGAHKAHLVATKRIPPEKTVVIHNSVDLRRFDSPVDVPAVRRSYGIPDGARVVAKVAALLPKKTHDVFLRAAALLLEDIPDAHFVIAGDGPERDKLEAMARNLRIADQVSFLGNVRDIPALLKSIDLSVLSSVHEAFPLALLESMAAARPVVATDVGSVSEMVVDGSTGFLVPPGVPDQFAQAMVRVLSDPELAREFGEEGRKRVEQEFTTERMISQTESLLVELANSARHSR